jgi:hypothetical protein
VKAQTLLERLPGFVFTAASPVHVSSDLGFLAFKHRRGGESPTVSGVDVALVRGGRIAVLHALVTAEFWAEGAADER